MSMTTRPEHAQPTQGGEATQAARASAVPVIDLAPARRGDGAARALAAAGIDAACREIGFFAVSGHGVPASVVDDLRACAHRFFSLPRADKLAARHPVAGTNRGYHPVGGEALAQANDAVAPPDLKEFFHVGPVDTTDDPYYTSPRGRPHFAPNIWPAEPAGFRPAAIAYYRALDRLVAFLMRLAALALGVDESFFDGKIDRSIGTMRLNYYPAQTAAPVPGQLRAGAHTDYGGFTILSGEDVPGGLEVRTRSGAWIHVPTRPDVFVVNIGDLLMRWTNDRWLSNLHRVVNPPASAAPGQARLSIAFFNHPNYDAVIECLPSQGAPRHPPVLSGEYRDLKYAKTGLAPTLGTPERRSR
jgi:isopenicillin N synthase-like dioxygenase